MGSRRQALKNRKLEIKDGVPYFGEFIKDKLKLLFGHTIRANSLVQGGTPHIWYILATSLYWHLEHLKCSLAAQR